MTRQNHRRTGLASLLLLLFLPGLFLFVLLVLSIHRNSLHTAELRNAGISASLAGSHTLADDALLTANPNRIRPLLTLARAEAKRLAERNFAHGKPAALSDADIVFGFTDWGFRGRFVPLDPNAANTDWKTLNSVEVAVRLAGTPSKLYRVRAFFDTNLIGFRPTQTRPAPLAPFAIFDDPANQQGWSDALARRTDQLQWAGTETTAGSDSLAEVQVFIGGPPIGESPAPVFAQPLDLGPKPSASPADVLNRILAQTSVGIVPNDLAGPQYQNEIKLDSLKRERPIYSAGKALNGQLEEVAQALRKRIGERLAWPLFTEIESVTTPHEARDLVRVNGFVAARLLSVSFNSGDSRIRLTLQEAVLATPTALTLPSLPPGEKAPPSQRALGKVRLAG